MNRLQRLRRFLTAHRTVQKLEEELARVRSVAAAEREHRLRRSIMVSVERIGNKVTVIATDPAGDHGREIEAAARVLRKITGPIAGRVKMVELT